MNYKLKGGETEKPVSDRTIEKTGSVQEFSLTGLYHDTLTFEKTLKELKGNRDLKDSVCKNIESHHPFVKDLSEMDRYTIHMYQENMALVKAYNKKIVEIEKAFKQHLDEIDEIKAQVPELADTVSPYIEQPAGLPKAEVPEDQKEPQGSEEICLCDAEEAEFCPVHDKKDENKENKTEESA